MITCDENFDTVRLCGEPIEKSNGVVFGTYITIVAGVDEDVTFGQQELVVMIVRVRYGDDGRHVFLIATQKKGILDNVIAEIGAFA